MRYRFRGLIFGGDYTWRGLFSKFYGIKSSSRGSCLKTGLIKRIEDLSETLVYYIAWKRGLSKVFLYAYAELRENMEVTLMFLCFDGLHT